MTYTPDAPMNIGTRGSPLALAQAYAVRGRASKQRDDLVMAHKLMTEVAMARWPDQYRSVGEIALAETNALIVELGGKGAGGVILDPKFIAALPVDVRVVTEWNTPRTDLDLWVKDTLKSVLRCLEEDLNCFRLFLFLL